MTASKILLLFAALLLTGCTVETSTGPIRNEAFAVERDKSEFLRVNLHMKAGELQLSGGAARFAEGEARCNVEPCKPIVKYSTAAGRANLSIEQASTALTTGNAKNTWVLRLADDLTTDLAVELGAGEAKLDAGSLSLRTVEVRMGAGSVDLDLRGDVQRDCEVRIRGGVGEAVIRLPKEAGIYATARGGIGSINVTGLHKDGDHWVNDAYGDAKRTIRADIQGGVGEIRVIVD
jgi:hypothetical protein